MSISVDQALSLILKHTPVLETEDAPLQEAVGRLLCCDIHAPMDQPPFNRTPLDGYAVIAADLAKASLEKPVVLSVVDKLFAGHASRIPVLSGQAVRLMTGSMIPQGADCVIRQEDTDEGETSVRIYKPVLAGSNYCRQGEEYRQKDLLFAAGQPIDAAMAAVIAGVGLTKLPVRRQLRAALISTGDEIQLPGKPLDAGKIYDSSSSYIVARLRQLGVQITAMETVGDNLDLIAAALKNSISKADLVITTGGVSVGQKDLVAEAVQAFGGNIIFHGIAVKPGMPTLFATKGAGMILGLSGNPFSAAVPFELFIRPILAQMVQNPSLKPRREYVQAANDFHKSSQTQRFLRAFCREGVVFIPSEQSNGQMRSMVGCNCLIDIPAGTGKIRQGDEVEIVWL